MGSVSIAVKMTVKLEMHAHLPSEFLPFSSLVILKPVEHILAFNLSIEREISSDLLDLQRIRGACSSSVHVLKDHELFGGGAPPGRDSLRHIPVSI